MQDYKFRLAPFQNVDFSEDEKEARFIACLEDARNKFEQATVTLEDDVLCITVKTKDELPEDDCVNKFREVLVDGSLYLFAEPLF